MTRNPLDEARAEAEKTRRLERKLIDLRARRDAAVIAAAAHNSPNTIASATGMSRTAVRNVVRAERTRIAQRIGEVIEATSGNTDTDQRQRLTEELNRLREQDAYLGRSADQ